MQEKSQLNPKIIIDKDLLNTCIHCGLCLPACPTYLATGRELESPRGRIYLLNLWQTGQEPFSNRMAEHLDSCLGCLGCQTACPSGVNYEAIFNQARLPVNAIRPAWLRALKYGVFRWVLTNDQLLMLFGRFLRFWQKIKADQISNSIAYATQLYRLSFIRQLLGWQSLLPEIPEHSPLPKLTSKPDNKVIAVQLFKGCVMDIFYNSVNQAAIKLLSLQSQIVAVPKQTCCGALAFHAGEKELASQLIKQNIEYFANTDGPIIVTASGCTAMLKTCHELFAHDDPWHYKAKEFSGRIQDLSEFLASHQSPISAVNNNYSNTRPLTIAYHAACHLAHAQGIRLEPKQLLDHFASCVNQSSGSELIKIVPLTEEEHCCGSAGIYNLTHIDLSENILARKIQAIKDTGADIIVTTNPGCLLQLQTGIKKQNLNIQVMHLAELLVKAD